MKWIPILLLSYCILAVGLSVYLGVAQFNAWKQSGVVLDQARQQLAEAGNTAEKAKADWLELDNEQRANRAGYDGPEAVAIGYSAQIAYEEYQSADQKLKAAVQREAEIEERTRTAAKNLVPLSIGFLLHLLGIFFLWPSKNRSSRITGSDRISR